MLWIGLLINKRNFLKCGSHVGHKLEHPLFSVHNSVSWSCKYYSINTVEQCDINNQVPYVQPYKVMTGILEHNSHMCPTRTTITTVCFQKTKQNETMRKMLRMSQIDILFRSKYSTTVNILECKFKWYEHLRHQNTHLERLNEFKHESTVKYDPRHHW